MKKRISEWLNPWRIFIIFFLILILLPAFASSEETYKFERMWPSLQQPWYLLPTDITVDENGNVYVANFEYYSVKKFNSDGHFITEWKSGYSGTWEPRGLAVDGTKYVYIIDAFNHCIQKFSPSGQFLGKWGEQGTESLKFQEPRGIALDGSGNLYVSDSGNHRIQVLSPEGDFVRSWGSHGTADGKFDCPTGITVDALGNVYVIDCNNSRVQKFTSDGQFITKWGSYGSSAGEFTFYDGHFWAEGSIDVDGRGNIYVSDWGNYRIQKFTLDGQFITEWGSAGPGDGQFAQPMGVATDTNGDIYVSDYSNLRIQKFSSEGQFIAKWGSAGSGNGEFNSPKGIVIDRSGNVYVADTNNLRIQKFSPEGQFITDWNSSYLTRIDIDRHGNIYGVDSWSQIVKKFTSDGQFITDWSYSSNVEGRGLPSGIAVDQSENVYVVDYEGHCIKKFTSDGQYITEWGKYGSGDGEFNFERYGGSDGVGIATDESGYVYVADGSNRRIQKFTSDGQFITKWGTKGSGDGEVEYLWGISVDSSYNVYVTDDNRRVQKFSPDGQFLAKFGENGCAPGQFMLPHDLAIGPNGKVYVADTGNNRIQVFTKEDSNEGDPNGGGPSGPSKAIIVAGGGPFTGNNIWDATQMCANFAYRTLTYQGFTKDTIYYLTSDTDLDLDGNGIPDDVDGDATNANFQSAITTWSKDAEHLFIYMVDHGGNGTFRIGELELLKAEDLDTWLDTLQNTIPGTVTLVYDACRSGSFIPILDPPPGKKRIIATSASSDEEAIFGSQGTISFSFLFWARMFNGDSLYDSFYHAAHSIGVTYPQNPLLEGNGNGIGNEQDDRDIVRSLKIGNETKSAGDIPVIGSVSPDQTLDGESSALIYAENIIDADGISRVWAVITPPDYSPGSSDNPVTDLPILDLTSTGSNRYEGTYNNFTSAGTYTIAIYASDNTGALSMPKATKVTVPQESDPDNYEQDDTFNQANVINLNGDPQSHCFHDTNDKDWVKFYGIAEEIYEIEASNPGAYCDVVIELYDTDGTTLLKGPWNWGIEGEDELMNWRCTQDGIYYAMARQYDLGVFGENTEYDLKVFRPTAPFPGFITGAITDAYSGGSIGGAIIRTDNNASALSLDDGAYLMVHPAGTFSLTALKPGYTPASYPGVEVSEGGTTTRYFILAPLNNGNDSDGDIAPLGNRDGTVNVGDALVALRFALTLETPTQEDTQHGDVAPLDAQGQPNPDGVINVGDALVILRKALGIIWF